MFKLDGCPIKLNLQLNETLNPNFRGEQQTTQPRREWQREQSPSPVTRPRNLPAPGITRGYNASLACQLSQPETDEPVRTHPEQFPRHAEPVPPVSTFNYVTRQRAAPNFTRPATRALQRARKSSNTRINGRPASNTVTC